MLSRERVNKGTYRMKSLTLFPLFQLTRLYWENRCLQILRKHCSVQLVPRPFRIQQIVFWFVYKFDKGGNSLPKHFERTPNIRSNL